MPYNSCIPCLANHMRSTSCHIMPLIINILGGGDTHTHTHTHLHRNNLRNQPHASHTPATRQHTPGLKTVYMPITYNLHYTSCAILCFNDIYLYWKPIAIMSMKEQCIDISVWLSKCVHSIEALAMNHLVLRAIYWSWKIITTEYFKLDIITSYG